MNEEQRKAAQDALDWLNWFGCRSQNRPNKTRQLITDNLAKALQQHAPDDAPDWVAAPHGCSEEPGQDLLNRAYKRALDAKDEANSQEQPQPEFKASTEEEGDAYALGFLDGMAEERIAQERIAAELRSAAQNLVIAWNLSVTAPVGIHKEMIALRAALEPIQPARESKLDPDSDEARLARHRKLHNIGLPPFPAEPSASPHYGIIDPDYAKVFTIARCLAWQEGYALAMHGSFTRDLDLVAIPWTDAACPPDKLVNRIMQAADLERHHQPGKKPHGRLAYTLMFKKFGDPRFVDISVAQRVEPKRKLLSLTGAEAWAVISPLTSKHGILLTPEEYCEIAAVVDMALRGKNHVQSE